MVGLVTVGGIFQRGLTWGDIVALVPLFSTHGHLSRAVPGTGVTLFPHSPAFPHLFVLGFWFLTIILTGQHQPWH